MLTRSKQGFDIPTHHWFRTILKPLLLETVNREAVEATGLFHWPVVHRAIATISIVAPTMAITFGDC